MDAETRLSLFGWQKFIRFFLCRIVDLKFYLKKKNPNLHLNKHSTQAKLFICLCPGGRTVRAGVGCGCACLAGGEGEEGQGF